MLRPNARTVACAVGLLAGCESSSPTPRLIAVQPARAHTDRPLRLQLLGAELIPAWQIDLHTGTRTGDARGFTGELRGSAVSQPLEGFAWGGTGQLTATLPAGLPAGRYGVFIRDPRGADAQLADGFESLGEDRSPPLIVLEQPSANAATAPGAHLRARLTVQDGGPITDVRWELRHGPPVASGRCPVVQGAPALSCSFDLAFPPELDPGDQLELRVEARDAVEPANVGRLSRTFLLGPPPTLVSVSPARGATAGGTEVVVRGTRLGPGSHVYFGRSLLEPQGGIVLDESTITGRTPAHAEGGALVRIETPLGPARGFEGQTLFEFAPPPFPRALSPPAAAPAGGTALTITGSNFTAETRVLQGTSLRTARPLGDQVVVNASEIRATSLPGQGRMSLFAVDPHTGWGALADALDLGPP